MVKATISECFMNHLPFLLNFTWCSIPTKPHTQFSKWTLRFFSISRQGAKGSKFSWNELYFKLFPLNAIPRAPFPLVPILNAPRGEQSGWRNSKCPEAMGASSASRSHASRGRLCPFKSRWLFWVLVGTKLDAINITNHHERTLGKRYVSVLTGRNFLFFF